MTAVACSISDYTSTTTLASAAAKGLVVLDTILDLVPFGSTASNLVDLSLKHLVIKDMDPESSAFKAFVQHIQEKKTGACLTYSVPIVGNVIKLGSMFYQIVKTEDTKPVPPQRTPLPHDLESMCDASTIGRRLDGQEEDQNRLIDHNQVQSCLLQMEQYKDFTRANT